jgi:hypothetical protein
MPQIVITAELDRRLQDLVPPSLRGNRKVALRVERVVEELEKAQERGGSTSDLARPPESDA